MIKQRELHEVPTLFQLLNHPDVYPYVRNKAQTIDEYYFLTKQIIEAETREEYISRTIIDEYYQPIGTIDLYDIKDRAGFLATWIGRPYFGKGYNQAAKQQFFTDLFLNKEIETIFLKIRKINIRSLKAAAKLPYVSCGKTFFPHVYDAINDGREMYDLFAINKYDFLAQREFLNIENQQPSIVIDGGVS